MNTALCAALLAVIALVAGEEPRVQVQCFKNIEINGKMYYDVLRKCIGNKTTEDVEFHECAQKEVGTTTIDYPAFVEKMARDEVKKQLLDTYKACEDKKGDVLSCVNDEWGAICNDDQLSKTEPAGN